MGGIAVVATGLAVLIQTTLKKPPLLSPVYLANLTTYYWLGPYALVCVGILAIMRRERALNLPTAAAAWIAVAAILYAALEMFRSPVDDGTTYLPYLALVTIAAVALVMLVTRTDKLIPESALEQL